MSRTRIRVRDVYDHPVSKNALVKPDEDLRSVISRFYNKAGVRSLFVVGREGKLLGVITRADLLNFAKFRLGGRLRLSEITRFLYAAHASDVVHPYSWKASVNLDDDIKVALDLMVEHDMIDVPVVDSHGKILGDLKLSKVLLSIMEEPENTLTVKR